MAVIDDSGFSQVPSRKEIQVGQRVWAIEKRNYGTGDLTEGVVQRILTRVPFHPRGIKVMFKDGTIARVQRLTPPDESGPVSGGSGKMVEEKSNPPTAEDLR